MANSTIILSLKNNIINALCSDPDISELIDSDKYSGIQLKGTHIFNYNKNPETIKEQITFITVMVDTSIRDNNGTFITPILTIILYTHNGHMELPNEILKENEYYNRNDYLSFLIDEKLNGNAEYGGYGRLKLIDNYEFVATKEFNGRKLIFKTVDVNEPLCNRW